MDRWRSYIKEPTSKECSENALVFVSENKSAYAMWYPQMGGYSARCVVILDGKWTDTPQGMRVGGCFDVLVWHDGEFPFDGEEPGLNPAMLHHCDPEQFIRFGQIVQRLNENGRVVTGKPIGHKEEELVEDGNSVDGQ